MSYVQYDFPTKAALKRAVQALTDPQVTLSQADRVTLTRRLTITPTAVVPNAEPTDGTAFLEGPHYPKPHTWYAKVQLRNSVVVKVLS